MVDFYLLVLSPQIGELAAILQLNRLAPWSKPNKRQEPTQNQEKPNLCLLSHNEYLSKGF